jgi:hypothetical protein
MFLVACVVAGLFFGIREFMFFAFLIGIGVILLILYLTISVTISDAGITTRSLFGRKSIHWSEIRHVSSKGAAIRLHNQDGSNTLSISPGLDQSVEIFDMLYSKRPDLFSIKKNNHLVRSFRSNLFFLAIGLLLIVLSLLLFFYKGYLLITGLLGLWICARALYRWYSSPRRITLENNCLILNYINRSYSITADNIAAIQIGRTKQNQFKSVAILFLDKNVMEISGFKQSPFVIYPVLSKWHQMYTKREPVLST